MITFQPTKISFITIFLGRESYIEFSKDINDNTNHHSSASQDTSPDKPKQNPTKDDLNSVNPQFIPNKSNSEVVFDISGQNVHLQREMGLWSGVSIIVGTIIGKFHSGRIYYREFLSNNSFKVQIHMSRGRFERVQLLGY